MRVIPLKSKVYCCRTCQKMTFLKIVSEYDQEKTQSQSAAKPMAPRGRATQQSHDTRKTLSKVTSSLIPIKMIAKLEGTYSNVQQNIEQLQNPTMGVTINNKSTIPETKQNKFLKDIQESYSGPTKEQIKRLFRKKMKVCFLF